MSFSVSEVLAWVGGRLSFYLVCSLGAIGNVGIGSLVYEQFHGWWMAGIAGAIVGQHALELVETALAVDAIPAANGIEGIEEILPRHDAIAAR